MSSSSKPNPFNVAIPDDDVSRMMDLMRSAYLPSSALLPGASWDFGVDLDWLNDMRTKFVKEFDWRKVERDMNRVHHYTVEIDDVTVHFVHEPSPDEGAVPILLLHGWPGTFWDFGKILESLYHPPAPCVPSFHVVVPSLPGYGFSPLPQKRGWTIEDTAGIFNKLMVDVLGYKEYFAQGGDWGAHILRIMSARYADSLRLVHFSMFRCPPAGILHYVNYLDYVPVFTAVVKTGKHYVRSLLLSELQLKALERSEQFTLNGSGYQALQSTKPATIGYACHDPLSLLAYIGEKFHMWSDPSLLDPQDIFTTVAIYHLTRSFPSSVVIYKESAQIRSSLMNDRKWKAKCRMGFSCFPYEIGAPPKPIIAAYGRLVFYKEHTKGGHFPALDNPKQLVSDIREMVSKFWWTDDSFVPKLIDTKPSGKPPGHPG